MRPLWQILISFKERSRSFSANCDECFQIMEHLADEAAAGADQESLLIAIKDHLTQCPHCHEHHQERLEQLESKMITMGEQKNSSQRV
jgi:phage regulator Rha-like protein